MNGCNFNWLLDRSSKEFDKGLEPDEMILTDTEAPLNFPELLNALVNLCYFSEEVGLNSLTKY